MTTKPPRSLREAASGQPAPRWLERPHEYVHLRKARLRQAGLALLALVVLLIAAHPLWLTALARLLIVDQPPRPADAILVLGGGSGEREEWGAELYHQGYAPLLIASGEPPHLPGEQRSFAAISALYLASLGVPASAILTMPETTSTYDEAILSRDLLRQRGSRSLIVVSDPHHLRRSAWTFRTAFRGEDVKLTFTATPVTWFRVERWWTRERDLLAVVQEYQKLLFYILSGRLF